MLSNQALKSCASDVRLYYPLKRSSPPLCFSFNQISSRLASWQTNSENDRIFFKKLWQIRGVVLVHDYDPTICDPTMRDSCINYATCLLYIDPDVKEVKI